jgi:hypothetical protein
VLGLAAPPPLRRPGGSRRVCERQIGGYTGDVLGAAQQMGEIAVLLSAAASHDRRHGHDQGWWVRPPVTVNDGAVYGQTDLPCDGWATRGVRQLCGAPAQERSAWMTSALQRTHWLAAGATAHPLAA